MTYFVGLVESYTMRHIINKSFSTCCYIANPLLEKLTRKKMEMLTLSKITLTNVSVIYDLYDFSFILFFNEE